MARGEEGSLGRLGIAAVGVLPLDELLRLRRAGGVIRSATPSIVTDDIARPLGARGSIPRDPDQFGTHLGVDSQRPFFLDEIGIPSVI
ncbi:MAG: hypothetical protein M3430_03720 [Acidobacteriota bacterium]|nr:hypothetical protein [Acidobacteriota bacterium]